MSDLFRWLANGHTIRWSGYIWVWLFYSAAYAFVTAVISTLRRYSEDRKRREAERRTAARRVA